MTASERPLLKILGNRSYPSLYLAAFISSTGASVTTITLSWIVYNQTHNALYISYLAISSILPNLTLGMFAGVIADRFNRKRVMIIADVPRAATVALLTLYLFVLGFNLIAPMVTAATVSSFSSIFTPSSSAITPQIVEKDSYESANGLLAASNSGAQVIGSWGWRHNHSNKRFHTRFGL